MSGADVDRDTGRLAIAAGVIALASIASLAVFFAIRGPFGTINDVGNGLTGLIAGLLAWRLRPALGDGPAALLVLVALAGMLITVIGSALVISGTTGFFFAGLVSSVGFALLGPWLVALNRSAAIRERFSGATSRLGVVAGVAMSVGIVTAPGIAQGLDDMSAAPWWVWVGYIGWFGAFLLYPVWAIRFGREISANG